MYDEDSFISEICAFLLTSASVSFFLFSRPTSLYINAIVIDYRFVTNTLDVALFYRSYRTLSLPLAVTFERDCPSLRSHCANIVVANKIYLQRGVTLHACPFSLHLQQEYAEPFNCSPYVLPLTNVIHLFSLLSLD